MALWNYGENQQSQWSVLFNASEELNNIKKKDGKDRCPLLGNQNTQALIPTLESF